MKVKHSIAKIITTFIFISFFLSCKDTAKKNTITTQSHDWHYFGQTHPGKNPVLFQPGIISTRRNERDFTVSPYGSEMYYTFILPANKTSVILYLKFDGAFWSEPQTAFFSGRYNDLHPAFSPDGKKIFFASDRPVVKDGKAGEFNIWYVEKEAYGWSEARFAKEINSKANELHPAISAEGKIFFTSDRKDTGFGKKDIYYSYFDNGNFSPPVNAGNGINTEEDDFDPFITSNGYLVFASNGRNNNAGYSNLYISHLKNDTSWTKPVSLGGLINSESNEYSPFVTFDGKYLFFTSDRSNPVYTSHFFKKYKQLLKMADGIDNGLGNIYWVEFQISE